MFLVSWVVYQATTGPCSDCPSGLATFINLDVLNKLIVNAGVAGGLGTIGSYVMFSRERQAREAAERRASEERQRADTERQRAKEIEDKYIRLLEARIGVSNGNGGGTPNPD